jgi:hypothetical protein
MTSENHREQTMRITLASQESLEKYSGRSGCRIADEIRIADHLLAERLK